MWKVSGCLQGSGLEPQCSSLGSLNFLFLVTWILFLWISTWLTPFPSPGSPVQSHSIKEVSLTTIYKRITSSPPSALQLPWIVFLHNVLPCLNPGYLGLFVMLLLFTLYEFAQAAITKIHKMSGNVLPHSSGDWKFKIKVSRGLLPSEGCEREPSPCLSLVSWWFPGNLRCSSACRNSILISTFIFTWCCSPSRLICVQLSSFF